MAGIVVSGSAKCRFISPQLAKITWVTVRQPSEVGKVTWVTFKMPSKKRRVIVT